MTSIGRTGKGAKAAKTSFFCTACGNEQPRWFGHCPGCGEWNTAAEAPAGGAAAQGAAGGAARRGAARWVPAGDARAPKGRSRSRTSPWSTPSAPPPGCANSTACWAAGWCPDRCCWSAAIPASARARSCCNWPWPSRARAAASSTSPARRASSRSACAPRLGEVPPTLLLLCETDLEAVLEAAARVQPDAMIADSIQTLSRADLEGGPGTVTQVRECGLALLHYAKGSRTPVFLVGHVTKDGAVAGPRVLEHMVDAVLYLEGERYQHYRVLRAAKNRFGSTNELGVFEMLDTGLREVANPSQAFLSDGERTEPGVAVVASLEGSRPLLVEVQALVSTSFYGTPQRVTAGFDQRRLAVLLAVLERRVGLKLGRHDVFVTVTGGLKLDDPGTDLGVALAIASSYRSRPLLRRTLALGEISLSGELRRVSRLDARLREAAQLGFVRAGFPKAQAADAEGIAIERVPLGTVREAFDALLGEKVAGPVAERAERAERTERPAPPAAPPRPRETGDASAAQMRAPLRVPRPARPARPEGE